MRTLSKEKRSGSSASAAEAVAPTFQGVTRGREQGQGLGHPSHPLHPEPGKSEGLGPPPEFHSSSNENGANQ